MSTIMTSITTLIAAASVWVQNFFRLFFTWSDAATPEITGVTFIGLVCIVIPLVGLGIGIIKRLVNIRA